MFFKAILGNEVDPTLQANVMVPNDFVECIYHFGCSHKLRSIIQSGLFAGRQDARKGRQTVFFATVNPVYEHLKKKHCGVTQTQVVRYKTKW